MSERIAFDDRGLIYRQGDRCRKTFFIDSGLVRLSRIYANGREIVIDIVGVGEVVGNLTEREVWTATEEARAFGPCTVMVMAPPTAVDAMSPELVQALMRRADKLKERLVSHLVESVERRLTRTLHDLALDFGVHCPHGFSLEILLTQQDLADIVGASRPVVSIALNRMKERGLLNYTAQRVCVHAEAIEAWGPKEGGPSLLSR